MKQKFPPTAKIAVKLLKSLYGHPFAGRVWQEHLSERLQAIGGVEIPEHPSNWVFRMGNDILLLNVYVDDLTLTGKSSLHASFWKRLREIVKLDPEIEIGPEGGRILGRLHRIGKSPGMTSLVLDMKAYSEQAVELYLELAGLEKTQLKSVPTPCLPESAINEADLQEDGALAKCAPRILMKCLCPFGTP